MASTSRFTSLLRGRLLRRLLAARMASQGADGVFQVALASSVLFNPEQAESAAAIAATFAVVLLPYSVLGPFAGVVLDRWPRRRVLVLAQLLRALAVAAVLGLTVGGVPAQSPRFLGAVLVVFSLNRFVLAGFSAALPHTVERDRLVDANSLAPTVGSLSYGVGLGLAGALRGFTTDAAVLALAVGLVLLAAAAAVRLPFVGPGVDGPAHAGRASAWSTVRQVAGGLLDALARLPRRAMLTLTVVLVSRVPFGVVLVQGALLARSGGTGTGLAGLGAVGAAFGIGFLGAVLCAPVLVSRCGALRVVGGAFAVAVLPVAALSPWVRPWSVLALAGMVGFVSQLVKVSCDTLVQTVVPDDLLGRAFSLYDLAYNSGMVVAAVFAAWSLPESGRGTWPVAALSGLYAAAALLVHDGWRRAANSDRPATSA